MVWVGLGQDVSKIFITVFRFHLYKENKDTQEVLGLIGKMLGVQVSFVSLCFSV